MKRTTIAFCTLLAFACLAAIQTCSAQTTNSPSQQPKFTATIKRATSAQKLNERGFSSGNIPVQAGMTYPVVAQDMGSVTILDGSTMLRLAKSDVELTAASVDGKSTENNVLHIISADYQATTGGTRYPVKEEIKKRIPKGPITEPISILIGDNLLRARASEVRTQSGILRADNTVILDAPKQMFLKIVYDWNGQRRSKEVRDGDTLVLP